MMWPFKKKSKLTAITATPYLVDTFPIVLAKKEMPSWYKDMPLLVERGECPVKRSITNLRSTIKNCSGVNSLLQKGFIVRAWADISIVVYPDGTFSSVGAAVNPPAEPHYKDQLPPSMQHYTVIKLLSPWQLVGDSTEYLYLPTAYHNALGRDYFMPVGVLNFKYQRVTHVFLAVEAREEPYEIVIKAGQPLMQLIPLTDNEVDLKIKYDPMYSKFLPAMFFLVHPYNRYVNWMKRKK